MLANFCWKTSAEGATTTVSVEVFHNHDKGMVHGMKEFEKARTSAGIGLNCLEFALRVGPGDFLLRWYVSGISKQLFYQLVEND